MTANEPIELADLPAIGPAAVTMGVFDGVHLGHRAVLEATRRGASELGATSVALVFDPPPEQVLSGSAPPRLAPLATNLARIEALGIDVAIPVHFDEGLRQLEAEAFIDALSPALAVRSLVMARGSAFGRERRGTVERMQQMGTSAGFEVLIVDPVEIGGTLVSSTRIRTLIGAGDLAGARQLGVEPYLEGTVVAGAGRGRELGFPTANLRFDYRPALPPLGIYAARVSSAVAGVEAGHPALLSIGTRPTFEASGETLAEAFLLDFDGDLYGAVLGVEIVGRLRDEERFANVDALVEQMRRDVEAGRAALARA